MKELVQERPGVGCTKPILVLAGYAASRPDEPMATELCVEKIKCLILESGPLKDINPLDQGGQSLISTALVVAVVPGLLLGEEVEVHAKGLREPLLCRELVGHEDYPELMFGEKEGDFAFLVYPVPVSYVGLADKGLDEQTERLCLVGLSHRRALIENASELALRTNLMVRLAAEADGAAGREHYAKVIRLTDALGNRYVIRFTSVPYGMRRRLRHLASR